MSLEEEERKALEGLERRFIIALGYKNAGKIDKAEDELRAILKIEPRLAEPRMELARVLLDTDRLGDAEVHARDALKRLEDGGQWTDEVPENVVLALCNALLAEILRRHADEDDVIFGDPAEFKRIVAEAQQHFSAAAKLDPSDDYASYYAFFMGVDSDGNDPLATDGIIDV